MDKRCAASGEKYTSYSTAKRKRPDGMIECPVCGKVVKLRKQGLDRWPTTLPYHDDNRGLSTAKGSNYPLLPGRQLGKRLVPVGAPQPPSASGERAYPAVTYAKAFQFLGSLANPLFETGFVGDDAHSSEIPNPRLVRLIQAMIDEDRAALAPSPGIDAAEQKPVAWMADDGRVANAESRAGMHAITQASYCIPLFAAPPAAQPSAEWMAEAERLVDAYAKEFAEGGATYARDIRRAAMLAHLRTKP